jgi:hypothetical protein
MARQLGEDPGVLMIPPCRPQGKTASAPVAPLPGLLNSDGLPTATLSAYVMAMRNGDSIQIGGAAPECFGRV